MDDVIILIAKDKTEKTKICEMKSIGQSEFYQAQSDGLKPEIKFVLSDYLDYENQKHIKHGDIIYTVLKTYKNGDKLEITCYGGVNNGSA